jgi:putative hydrolase of HD superfamily
VPAAEAESVADHSFRTALLAWLAALLAEPALDADRVLKLALIHDLAEALTGDDPPYAVNAIPGREETAARRAFLEQRHVRDPARSAAKQAAEDEAMRELVADLPAALAAELQALWAEYRAQASPEARFVKQADRLETFLQAREYQAADPSRPMASFAAEVAELVTDPALLLLRDAIATLTPEPPER